MRKPLTFVMLTVTMASCGEGSYESRFPREEPEMWRTFETPEGSFSCYGETSDIEYYIVRAPHRCVSDDVGFLHED